MPTLKTLIDETSNIKNEIVNCHTNLKNNLETLGVECSDTDKLNDLISKTNEIKSFPSGWDNEKYGEVFLDDSISEGDAVILQTYGSWDEGADAVISPFDVVPKVPNEFNYLHSQFTSDGNFLITGSTENAFYKVEGDRFIFKNIGGSALTSKVGDCFRAIGVRDDSEYIFLEAESSSNPIYFIFKKSGNSYTLQASHSSMSGYMPDTVYAKFSKSKKFLHLFGDTFPSSATSTPTVCNYFELNESTGKYVPNSTSPRILGGLANVVKDGVVYLEKFDCFFLLNSETSSNGAYIVFFNEETKKYTTGTLSNYFTNVPTAGQAVACSPGGEFFAWGNGSSNNLYVYRYSLDSNKYEKLPNVSIKPNGTIYSIEFDNSGNYLVVTHSKSPYISIYKWDGNTFQQTTRLNYTFKAIPSDIAFSPNNKFLYVALNDGSYSSKVFLTETKDIVTKYNTTNSPIFQLSKKEVGIALETKNNGEQIKVNTMPKLIL